MEASRVEHLITKEKLKQCPSVGDSSMCQEEVSSSVAIESLQNLFVLILKFKCTVFMIESPLVSLVGLGLSHSVGR